MAAAWNEQSNAAKKAPGAHRAAIESFVRIARQMGMGEEAARKLARRIIEVPVKKDVKIRTSADQARLEVEKLARSIALLKDKEVQIRINRATTSTYRGSPGIQRAAGGPVHGPGGPTSDSIPAWLSNGEYVVKAAAVRKYGRSMMDQLNAMRFASGGFVGRGAGSGAMRLSPGDVQQLAQAVAQARPLYGDVHLAGDGAFEREVRQRRNRAGGGV
jgi:hypothetical protein